MIQIQYTDFQVKITIQKIVKHLNTKNLFKNWLFAKCKSLFLRIENRYWRLSMDKLKAKDLFDKYTKKLRIVPEWDIRLEFVEDEDWKKTGDFKIDPTDKKAILMLNASNPKDENIEETIVHELMHIKMYPLDQVCESMIINMFEEGSKEQNFAYQTFFETLEVTVEELAKCFLLEFGENKEFSFGRMNKIKSFNELYDGLKKLD